MQYFTDRASIADLAVRISLCLMLAGCNNLRQAAPWAGDEGGRAPTRAAARVPPAPAIALPAAGSGRGGYYQDDGPGSAPPADLQAIPDAEPRVEPYTTRGNKPYAVFGKSYVPITDGLPLKQRGVGSWYGRKFHGQKTSSGEIYDMYKMTAAHPTLPLPSYARVTNVRNGAQVIVRINDRGPFHSSRIIDLSYTAALKLGYIGHGSAELEVERLLPDEIARINGGRDMPPAAAAAAPAPTPAPIAPKTLSMEDFLLSGASANIFTVSPLSASPQIASLPASPFSPALPAPPPSLQLSGGESAAPAGGYYLQFGAYARSANADALREQLMQRWPHQLPLPQVQQNGVVYRLYSGPFGNHADALQAAALLSDNPVAKPQIVQR